MLASDLQAASQGFAACHSSLHTDASWRRVLIRHEVSQATVVAAAMATDEPLLGDTETGQSPAIAHQDTQTTRTYGALDDNAKEEQRKKEQRREQNQLDIEGMNVELDVYKTNVKGEDAEDRWKQEFLQFKNDLMLNRARNLVENTARELYMDGRACANVKTKTILAQPKLTAVVSAMTPKQENWARQWYDVIQVTAQKVDDRVEALEKLQEETKKRDRAAQATVLTTMMSLIVSVANGMTEDQQLAKLISNVAPILLTILLAFKTISETKHDKDMQEDKKKYLVEDYKSAMYDISRFASEGAQLSGNADESKDGSDGGAGESNLSTKPEVAEAASAAAPAPAAPPVQA